MSDHGRDNEEIVEKLRSFLGSEFDDASLDEVTGALDELADEFEDQAQDSELGRQASLSEVQARDGSEKTGILDSFSSAIEPFDVDEEGERPLITISSLGSKGVERLLDQLLDVGAVWLTAAGSPQINQEVELLVDLPSFGFELAVTGRVVHQTPEGTAVDVSEMEADAVESLEEVRETLRQRKRDQPAPGLDEVSSRMGGSSAPLDETGQEDSSGLDLSRTFESLGEDDEYWYGPKSGWIDTADEDAEPTRRTDAEIEPLLLELSAHRFSGLADISMDDREWQLHFDEGFVVDLAVEPRSADHELGPLLRLADRVSEDELGQASSYGIKNKVSLERALHDLEILSDDAIRRAVAGRIRYLLRELCDLPPPDVALYEAEELADFSLSIPEVRAHVPAENVVFRRRFDRFDQAGSARRDELLAKHAHEYPRVAAGAEGRIERSFFDEAHRRMVDSLVDGGRRLEDLVTESFLPPAETVSVVLALQSMDLLSFEADPETLRAAQYAEDEAEIKHLSVHKASFFEVLNIHWSCYDVVIEEAYESVSRAFDLERAPDGIDDEAARKFREISERVDEAYEVLSDRDTRQRYRAKIMPEYKLEHAIPLLMKRAQLARYSDRHDVARDSIARILELSPSHREAQEMYRELRPEEQGAAIVNPSEAGFGEV